MKLNIFAEPPPWRFQRIDRFDPVLLYIGDEFGRLEGLRE
jgi:hypothetical protein